jgi:hypothetical protein
MTQNDPGKDGRKKGDWAHPIRKVWKKADVT